MVRLSSFEGGLRNVQLYAKAEWQNPGGSVKDRAAARMIADAERSGQLALEYANDGSRRPWSNPETGTTGTITPTKTFQSKDGAYCREYDQTIQIRQRGSKDIKGQGSANGVACRQANGRWKFLS